MQDERGKELLSGLVFGTVASPDEKRQKVSEEARVLREKMIGYVDTVIER